MVKKQSLEYLANFKPLSYEEQANLCASGWAKSLISGIGTFTNVFASPFFKIIDQINKNKLINLIKSAKKGEIEFGKDGQIKFKFDMTEGPIHNSIIF